MSYALERGRQSLLRKCPVTAERYQTRGLLINLEPETGAEEPCFICCGTAWRNPLAAYYLPFLISVLWGQVWENAFIFHNPLPALSIFHEEHWGYENV